MITLLYFALLALGLLMITFGANYLTGGSVSIAERFGVPQLIIGLTIVGFGTSAPELVVSITSALQGKPDIAIANVLGSNTANILLILGISALISPLHVSQDAMKRDIPFAIIATLICVVMASDVLLGNTVAGDIIDRADGIILLSLMAFYLYLTLQSARTKTLSTPPEETPTQTSQQQPTSHTTRALLLSIAKVLGGLGLLILGGRLFVDNASAIARSWGVSEAIIGLTIVAVGTSLPELATSIVAALKHQPDLAIGNVVGSNIFNILLILGSSATITPLVPAGLQTLDFAMGLIAILILFAFSNVIGRSTLSRVEGGTLLGIYLLYIGYLVYQATAIAA